MAISLLWWLTILVYTLAGVGALLDFRTEFNDQGSLGMKLDYNLARHSGLDTDQQTSDDDIRTLIVSTRLVFKGDVNTLSDGQLVQMGGDAFREKLVEFEKYGLKKTKQTSLVTLLAVGNEIYISTPMRGSLEFTYSMQDSPVVAQLMECAILARRQGLVGRHRFGATCGEPMVAHQYFRIHQDQRTLQGLGARVVSVRVGGTKGIKVIDPCGTVVTEDNLWGCNLLAPGLGMRVLDVSTEPQPFDLFRDAGGLDWYDQVSLCT
ncbi:hypothetical protein AMS68_001826 [Peltaster fructicola]|uniref:Uncharacterized protein n=1 Tax=Peltaster fructicola TaxID=286661 RepID=A0A6H0XNV6_9PEZI|nr:hypothetical protein AMS68_001826 [Peltaster fructicola]